MATPSGERKVRGTARVAFIAHLDTITAELGQGHTAQAIYERHQAKLGNSISYQQFARYVRQLREDGMVQSPLSRSAPRPLSPAKPPPPPPAPEPKPQTSAQLTSEGP
ncbi:MAG: TraK family protein, partial [Janthinobacterium lividum]